MFEFDGSVNAAHVHRAARRFVFDLFAENFFCAFETREGFRQLRSDGHELKDGRDEHRQETGIGNKGSAGHRSG